MNNLKGDDVEINGMLGLRSFMCVVLDDEKEDKISKNLAGAVDWKTKPIEIRKYGFKLEATQIEIKGTFLDLESYSDLFSYELREDGLMVPANKKPPLVAVGCIIAGTFHNKWIYQVDILSNIIFKEDLEHYHTMEPNTKIIAKKLVGISETGKFNNKYDDEYSKPWIKKRFKTEDEAKKFLSETLKKLKKSKLKKIYVLKALVLGGVNLLLKPVSWFFEKIHKK